MTQTLSTSVKFVLFLISMPYDKKRNVVTSIAFSVEKIQIQCSFFQSIHRVLEHIKTNQKNKTKKPRLLIRRGTMKLCTTICILTPNRGLCRSSGAQSLSGQRWCLRIHGSQSIQLLPSFRSCTIFRWRLPLFIIPSSSVCPQRTSRLFQIWHFFIITISWFIICSV